MQSVRPLTFVVASNDRRVLEDNFLASACLYEPRPHQVIIQEGFSSASRAYNDAIEKAQNDIIVFAHQDVIFPAEWISDLERSLRDLQRRDPDWGVIGCWGASRDDWGVGWLYSTGLGMLGRAFDSPQPVQTLDEAILVIRKSSGLRFDSELPHFHLYGTDICLRAEAIGRKRYVVPAFCVHNTRQILVLPPEFYECYWYIRRLWKDRLPVQTPCIRITRSNFSAHVRKVREALLRRTGRDRFAARRAENVDQLLSQVSAIVQREKSASSPA